MKKKSFFITLSVATSVVVCLVLVLLFRGKDHASVAEDNVNILSVHVEDDDVVFMGERRFAACDWSSMLENDKIKVLAFDGNTIRADISRIDKLFGVSRPSRIFLMYGEEELIRGEIVGDIAEEYEELVKNLQEHFPYCEIVIFSVPPFSMDRNDRKNTADVAERVSKLNIFVKMIAMRYNYTFADVARTFSTEDGILNDKFSTDGFELSDLGNMVLKSWIKDYMN